MAAIYPFKALVYNREKVGRIADVVTQPYDKITDEMRERYYAASPYNLVRIILGKPLPGDNERENVYTRAADYFKRWLDEGVFVQLERPALFAYSQEYQPPDGTGRRLERHGFIGLGRIEDYSSGIVYRHERTLEGPKRDRLELLRHTRAHFGQIFMLYSDKEKRIDRLLEAERRREPDIEVEDEYGVRHLAWRIDEREKVRAICSLMEEKKLIIADGHHRYETALAYRNERRAAEGYNPEAPYEKVMMTFINMDSEGLTILPTHRAISGIDSSLVSRLPEAASQLFTISRFAGGPDEFRRELAAAGRNKNAIGWYLPRPIGFAILIPKSDSQRLLEDLSPRQRALDVVILHRLLIERCLGLSESEVAAGKKIAYLRELNEAVAMVEGGRAQAAFLLNPTRIDQVREMAFAGETLPQKSTDFYPKLLSGLTIYRLEQ